MIVAEFRVAAARLGQDELRSLIRTLSLEERAVSDRRLALHRLVDRVRIELIALAHKEAGSPQTTSIRAASQRELERWTERACRAREGSAGLALDRFSPADVARLLWLLRDEEREISRQRRELHQQIDALHEELLGRLQRRVERVR